MTIIETLAWLKQGLINMKEGLGEMKKLVEQCFNQVDRVLADMKGAYNAMSLHFFNCCYLMRCSVWKVVKAFR